MKRPARKEATDLRRQHNQDILRRLRSGEALMSYDSKDSWYPPRPIIKKDEREMARVYSRDDKRGGDDGMGEAS
jgi:hypothetical protein